MGVRATLKYHYSHRYFTYPVKIRLVHKRVGVKVCNKAYDVSRRYSQAGSLAGAAHLLNDNAGVLR